MKLFFLFLIIRIFNRYNETGMYHPDEYWQSTELAYSDVYGVGSRPWEYNIDNPVRSAVYPGIFIIYYEIIKYLDIDSAIILSWGSKIIQSFLSAIMDYHIIKLCQILFPNNSYQLCIFILYTTPISIICATRTLSNSIEGILLAISLYYWIQKENQNNEYISRICITLNFLCRASSLIPWPGLFLYRLIEKKEQFKNNLIINIVHALGSLITEFILDSLYYKKQVLCSLNFLLFNFTSGQAGDYFGSSPFFQYILYALPEVMGWWIFFAILGFILWSYKNTQKEIMLLFVQTMYVLSITSHKEDRFLFSVFVCVIIFATVGFNWTCQKLQKRIPKYYKFVAIMIFILISARNYGKMFENKIFYYVESYDAMEYLQKNNREYEKVIFLTGCFPISFNSEAHMKVYPVIPDCTPTFGNNLNEHFRLQFDTYNFTIEYLNKHLNQYQKTLIITESNYFDNDDKIYNLLRDKYRLEEIHRASIRPYITNHHNHLGIEVKFFDLIFLRKINN